MCVCVWARARVCVCVRVCVCSRCPPHPTHLSAGSKVRLRKGIIRRAWTILNFTPGWARLAPALRRQLSDVTRATVAVAAHLQKTWSDGSTPSAGASLRRSATDGAESRAREFDTESDEGSSDDDGGIAESKTSQPPAPEVAMQGGLPAPVPLVRGVSQMDPEEAKRTKFYMNMWLRYVSIRVCRGLLCALSAEGL